MDRQHILLFGATGASGLAFLDAYSESARKPKLTLYIRPKSTSKLPQWATNKSGIRIVEGNLDDEQALRTALSPSQDQSFPAVTTIISFLGAYLSLQAVFTRDQSHPIADAFQRAILPAMRDCKVSRILVLSTPTAFSLPDERNKMSWKWWFYTMIPLLLAPQGNAEMKGIAEAVVRAGAKDDKLEWTVFRVPHLTDDNPPAKVIAGSLDRPFEGGTDLSRGSLVRWVLGEVDEKNWVRRAPLLANA
ncbi:hypothetical protein PV11_07313 [Exophiala sideris]|uniref:NAD(P)-binding domain-containing protein n=1 Tax=Exophiala sideris TaxID=1016849 RepID=A0A0D1YFU6_9EURO|nr:hypothetical protein PV11_07313 [Exophiala sideris]